MYNRAVFVERQLKELQDAHKKAEYQSIKKIGEAAAIAAHLCTVNTI